MGSALSAGCWAQVSSSAPEGSRAQDTTPTQRPRAAQIEAGGAAVIKRILSPLSPELEGDLRDALAIAVRLRPRSPRTSHVS